MVKMRKNKLIKLYRILGIFALGIMLCTGCQKEPEKQTDLQEEREVIDLGLSFEEGADSEAGANISQDMVTETSDEIEKTQEELTKEELYRQEQIRMLGNALLEETETKDGIVFPEEPMQLLREMSPEHAGQMEQLLHYWESTEDSSFLNVDGDYSGIPEDDSVCFVVLGYQLKSDGTMRKELIGRLETALNMAKQYPNSYVLVTGGGTAPGNAKVTEAGSMAEWLLDNGLDEKRIIIENQSMTTAENALFSFNILNRDYPEIQSIVMVTSDYHVAMGALLFEAQALWTEGENKQPHVINNVPYISGRDYRFGREELKYWLEILYQQNFLELEY